MKTLAAMMVKAARECMFLDLRSHEEHTQAFVTLLSRWSIPLHLIYRLEKIGGHWYEYDSSLRLVTGLRAAFAEWEYSTGDAQTFKEIVENAPIPYMHPTLHLLNTDTPCGISVEIPVCDLTIDFEASLKTKYRYMVHKALEQELTVEHRTELTDREIEWALRNMGHRFGNDDIIHAWCIFLWSVARRNVFVVVSNAQGLQAIGGFNVDGDLARFASFVSSADKLPNIGLRTLVEAVNYFAARGLQTLDPTARCTLFDEGDKNYVYKRRVCNAERVAYCLGSSDDQTWTPPFYDMTAKDWKYE